MYIQYFLLILSLDAEDEGRSSEGKVIINKLHRFLRQRSVPAASNLSPAQTSESKSLSLSQTRIGETDTTDLVINGQDVTANSPDSVNTDLGVSDEVGKMHHSSKLLNDAKVGFLSNLFLLLFLTAFYHEFNGEKTIYFT